MNVKQRYTTANFVERENPNKRIANAELISNQQKLAKLLNNLLDLIENCELDYHDKRALKEHAFYILKETQFGFSAPILTAERLAFYQEDIKKILSKEKKEEL